MWYKFTGDHGPGHQSQTIRYRWYSKHLDKANLEGEWEEVFSDIINRSQISGNAQLVDKLPEDIREQKIRKEKR